MIQGSKNFRGFNFISRLFWTGEKQGTAPAILDDGFVVSDDISDEEEVAEDPLDWWVDEEITRTDSSPGNGGVDMGMGGKNLKGSNGSNDA